MPVTPRRTAVAANPRGRQLLIALVAVIVIVALFKIFGPHENRYEKIAREVTVALQNNDIADVEKYQNAETSTLVTRGIVGRAADRLAPLGKLKSVKETTPSDAPARVHEFDVVFANGAVIETIKFDPDAKIVHFDYKKAGS
jgi:hypothetical protein